MIKRSIIYYIILLTFSINFISCISVPILDFEKQLIDKGYVETFSDVYPSKIYRDFIENKDPSFKYPFIYEIKKAYPDFTAVYKYYFDSCGDEMINKYIMIIIINKNGFYKKYENENINKQITSVVKLNESITNGVTGEVIETPVLYLWD